MIRKDVNYDEFQYVVEKVKAARICFGSALKRDTNPIGKGISAFQRRYAIELHPKITPQTYDLDNFTGIKQLENKVQSNKGVGGLANKAPRDPILGHFRVPSPTRYDTEPLYKTFKQNVYPFGRNVGRKDAIKSKTPGPGTHDHKVCKCRRTKMANNFGRPCMIPAVEEQCVPVVYDVCSKCLEMCKNDYWQKEYTTFLCHICMAEEQILYEVYKRKELNEFKKIRTCWYRHSHEGTNAKVQILTPVRLAKRRRVENYLSLYIAPF